VEIATDHALPPRFNRAVVALYGGAALLVGGCEDRAPLAAEDCVASCGSLPEELPDSAAGRARGCPPLAHDCDPAGPCGEPNYAYDAFWMRDDGTAQALALFADVVDLSRPSLLPASDGAPWLFAKGRAFRFDAWAQRFNVPAALPALSATPELTPVAIDAGAFVWLHGGDGPAGAAQPLSVRGFRFDTRSRFESDLPLLVAGAEHLAPNQPTHRSDGTNGDIFYDGALRVTGASARVFITDTTYTDFRLEVRIEAGAIPALILDDARFEWPNAITDATEREILVAERTAQRLTLRRGALARQTSVTSQRVRIGLAGASTDSVGNARASAVSRLEVRRSF
jgi:hypothetical protein